LNQVVGKLTEAGFEPDHSEVTMLASTTSPCDTEQARKVLTLIDVLEDLDDVQEVYSNGEFPDDAYE
jgi:transcriptional/translational regulatory protein YebC/TACO1